MGKTFISMMQNHINILDFKNQWKHLYKPKKIISASNEEFFIKLPDILAIRDIELGCDGTKETIFRFHNPIEFIVVDGTVKI